VPQETVELSVKFPKIREQETPVVVNQGFQFSSVICGRPRTLLQTKYHRGWNHWLKFNSQFTNLWGFPTHTLL